MLTSWKFVIVMAAIVSLAGLFAFGFTRNPREVQSPLVGRPAPGFAVVEINTGEALSLESLRGTPFVLNFWASWCTACKAEAPILEAAYERYERAGHGVRIVGVAVQDTVDDARRFAARYGKQYYLALDNARGDISLNWGLYGVPETFFVDAHGLITHKHIGALTGPAMQAETERILVQPPGGSPSGSAERPAAPLSQGVRP